jgi:hypothetical protein
MELLGFSKAIMYENLRFANTYRHDNMKKIPPKNCSNALHSWNPSETLLTSYIIVDPLVVSADVASKSESMNEIGSGDKANGREDNNGNIIHANNTVKDFSRMFSTNGSLDLFAKKNNPPRKLPNNAQIIKQELVSLSERISIIAGKNANPENTRRTTPSP